jgi:hypothetical protein
MADGLEVGAQRGGGAGGVVPDTDPDGQRSRHQAGRDHGAANDAGGPRSPQVVPVPINQRYWLGMPAVLGGRCLWGLGQGRVLKLRFATSGR